MTLHQEKDFILNLKNYLSGDIGGWNHLIINTFLRLSTKVLHYTETYTF